MPIKRNAKIVIADYGMGNLFNLKRAIEHIDGTVKISNNINELISADRLIIPGVGSFANGIKAICDLGISDAIYEFVNKERPLLGICLGMQLLMSRGYESGISEGLGVIQGVVQKLYSPDHETSSFKVPHIGWNSLKNISNFNKKYLWANTILNGLSCKDYFYFVHSYYVLPVNRECIIAETVYGKNNFCSVIHQNNVFGCQFHPERSGEKWLQILKNFIFN